MRRGAGLGIALLTGAFGAAAGPCETVDLGPPPADINACRPSQQYFIDVIWPDVLGADYGGRHCYDGGCHDAGSMQSLKVPPPVSAPAVPLPPDWAAIYKSTTEQMSCSDVASSKLLRYPTGLVIHGGGKLFGEADPQAMDIQAWVSAP